MPPSRFDNRLVLIGFLILLGIGAALIALGFAIVWSRWPWAVVTGYLLLALFTFSSAFRSGRFETALLGIDPVSPVPSVEAEYRGIYTPHWEVPHVRVLVGWKLFGLLPRYESWWPLGGGLRSVAEYRDDSSVSFVVRFRGIPSELGRFGHKGSAQRKIQVVELIDASVMPKQSEVRS